MALEAVANKKNHNTVVYTRARWLHWSRELRVLPALPYVGSLRQDQPLHWGSGVYAVLLACFLGFKEIYIAGFDLYGNFGKINNIYEGSINYKQQNSSAIDPALWIYQLSKIFQTHEHTNFYIVNSLDWQFPEEWKYPNVYFKNILAI